MFSSKKIADSTALNSTIDSVVSAFTTAVANLTKVSSEAQKKIQEHDDQIKLLTLENDALNETIKRADSITEKLRALVG